MTIRAGRQAHPARIARIGTVVVILLTTGCLSITSSVRVYSSDLDFPDPTAWYLSGTQYQVFATSAYGRNIPMTTVSRGAPRATTAFSAELQDAIAIPPNTTYWVANGVYWAPSIIQVGSRFVLSYSGGRAGGSHCIGYAEASTPQGPFTPVASYRFCGSAPNIGLFDPEIVDDGTGRWWMFYSEQIGNRPSFSKLRAVPVDPGSLAPIGPPRTVLGFDAVASKLAYRSPSDQIENPTLRGLGRVGDQLTFALSFSLGHWERSNYATFTTGLTIDAGTGAITATKGASVRDTFASARVKQRVGTTRRGGMSVVRNRPSTGILHASTGASRARTAYFVDLSPR